MVNTIVTTLVTCWTTGKAVGWCVYSYYMNCLWESNPTNPVTVISAPTHLLTERYYHVTCMSNWWSINNSDLAWHARQCHKLSLHAIQIGVMGTISKHHTKVPLNKLGLGEEEKTYSW